jgi:hypothetical protein
MSNTRLKNEPLEKASGGTSYAEERDDERVRRTRLGSRSFVFVCRPHGQKKKKKTAINYLALLVQLTTWMSYLGVGVNHLTRFICDRET